MSFKLFRKKFNLKWFRDNELNSLILITFIKEVCMYGREVKGEDGYLTNIYPGMTSLRDSTGLSMEEIEDSIYFWRSLGVLIDHRDSEAGHVIYYEVCLEALNGYLTTPVEIKNPNNTSLSKEDFLSIAGYSSTTN